MSQSETFESSKSQQYEQPKELFGCQHIKLVTYGEKNFCSTCGVYKPNSQTRVFRSLKLKFNTFFNPMKILEKALSNKSGEKQTLSNKYHQIRNQIIEFLIQAATRLNLSMNSVFFAMVYLDKLDINQPGSFVEEAYLYASTALMLAAKSSEIDERIPFISKLKKYASMTNHPEINYLQTEQFRKAERILIQGNQWMLQGLSLLDRVEFLLCFGVLDDDDTLVLQEERLITGVLSNSNQINIKPFEGNSSSSKKEEEIQPRKSANRVTKLKDLPEERIQNIVKNLEEKYTQICLQVLQDPIFESTEHSLLALSIVGFLRKNCGLMNVWSQHLQSLTDFTAQQISSTVSQLMVFVKPDQNIQPVHSYITAASSKAPLLSQQPTFTRSNTSLFQPLQPTSNVQLFGTRIPRKNFSFLSINENNHLPTSYLSDKLKTLGQLTSYPLKISEQNKYMSTGLPFRSFY